ncbi:MAG: DUF1987 domain-containing protein [Sphingobacteriaceae bacterium]|nr:DUF1987 domain-containing protein [Sphingobacteriaceae bacterium]
MRNYILLEVPNKSPEIILTYTGEIMITGNSKPENPHKFYQECFTWIDQFIASAPKRVNVTFDLEYINSTSVKVYSLILKKLKTLTDQNCELTVNWRHEKEDDDSVDQGKLFEENLQLKFNFIEK